MKLRPKAFNVPPVEQSQAPEEGMVLAPGSVAHSEQRKAKEGSRGWVSPASHLGSSPSRKCRAQV